MRPATGRKRIGRVSKLHGLQSADRQRFLALLSQGVPQTWACKAIGISYESLRNWRARAELDEEPFADFIKDVEQAQARFVGSHLLILNALAMGWPLPDRRREACDAELLKWQLERLFPRDFGRQRRFERTLGDEGRAPVVIVESSALGGASGV